MSPLREEMNLKLDSKIHPFDAAHGKHRKSIRLTGYDYCVGGIVPPTRYAAGTTPAAQAGGYFVTIVTQLRGCFFGEISGGEMIMNDAGKMVVKWWDELPHKFPSVTVDTFVVMPNHFHGIILIHETVGADLRVGPGDMEKHNGLEKGEHIGSPLRNNNDGMDARRGMPRPNAPLSQIVQWFKTMTTNDYIRGVKQSNWPQFYKRLWQRNYYEHIIRDQPDYERIAGYIADNPSNWAGDEENPVQPLLKPANS
jgi:REP element-mobilizing transposase RayT